MRIHRFAKIAVVVAVLACAMALVAGCSGSSSSSSGSSSSSTTAAASTSTSATASSTEATPETGVAVSVSALKGPTAIGLVKMMDNAKAGSLDNNYTFTISGTADEVVPAVVQGTTDIALVPANVASILYQKTNKGITVIDINTLGVLYVVTGDTSITSLADLAGHTVYMTGKGTTPEYVMNYLLEQNGLSDKVTLEYKTEATEVAAVLASDPTAIAVLPQPYATVVSVQNNAIKSVVSLSDEWDKLQGNSGSKLVTGVTVVRNEFLEKHPTVVAEFLKAQSASVDYVNANPDDASQLVVDAGIIEKAPIAAKAIPNCNLVCITGSEMKSALSGYLKVLYDQDATSVGGSLPDDAFYYDAA